MLEEEILTEMLSAPKLTLIIQDFCFLLFLSIHSFKADLECHNNQ